MQQTGLASYDTPTICRMFVTIEKPNLNANSRVFEAETTINMFLAMATAC